MITYLKLGGILAAIAIVFGLGFHFGGMGPRVALERDHAAMAKATTDALLSQRAHDAAQAINDNAAETVHDQDLEAIPLHVIHDTVFVRLPATPNSPVPGTKAEAGGEHPASGATEQRLEYRDIGPGLAAFEARYETVLADCRRLNAEWPK